MTTLNAKEITENFNLPIEQVQERLETELTLQGYVRRVYNTKEAYQRAVSGSTDVTSMPRGKELLIKTINSLEELLKEMVESELQKKRKSRFYDDLILAPLTKFLEDDRKCKQNSWCEKKYENPMLLLPYFLGRELSRIIVTGEVIATDMARKACDAYYKAYNGYVSAPDSHLISTLQILRTYMQSEHNVFYTESKKQSTVTFKMAEQYDGIVLTEEDVLETLEGQFAKFKPMLSLPIPHRNLLDVEGGYFTINSPLLKRSEEHLVRQIDVTDSSLIKTINEFQSTAWQINVELYEWMKECKYEGVHKHFSTSAAAARTEIEDFKKKTNSKLRDKKKHIKNLRFQMYQDISFEKKEQLARDIANTSDEIEMIEIEFEELKSQAGKVIGWEETLKDVEFYKHFPVFYHPLFCDKRGRIYTYNTSLSFQGSGLAKSLIQTAKKERLTNEGLETCYELLGGMVDGLSKAKTEKRVAFIKDKLDNIFNVIEHKDYSFLNILDEDELMVSLPLIKAIYDFHHNEKAVTGILAYIDSTSSAIQVQALVQHCERAAWLTNLTNTEEDTMPDAYLAVADTCKALVEDIAQQTDEDLKDVLATYIKQTNPDDLTYLDLL